MDKPQLPIFDQMDHAIRILEEERRRIARDLHDGPVQALTNISMKLDITRVMLDSNPDLAKSQLEQLHKRVGSIVNEIRHLIYDLRPIAVDEVGFVEATRALCVQCTKNWDLPIELTVEEGLTSNTIAPAKQVALYRLVQEILNNMKKHAKATKITIEIWRHEENLNIEVADNGIGFNPNDIPPGHYGLMGMKERAMFLGGDLEISSVLNSGSTFVIVVPVFSQG